MYKCLLLVSCCCLLLYCEAMFQQTPASRAPYKLLLQNFLCAHKCCGPQTTHNHLADIFCLSRSAETTAAWRLDWSGYTVVVHVAVVVVIVVVIVVVVVVVVVDVVVVCPSPRPWQQLMLLLLL